MELKLLEELKIYQIKKQPEFDYDGILVKEYYFESNDLLNRLNEKVVLNN